MTDEEIEMLGLLRRFVTLCRGSPAPSVDTAAILKELANMSDKITQGFDAQDAKLQQVGTRLTALEQRVAARDKLLAAVQKEKDQATADLAKTRDTLQQVQAELAAMPHVDTAAIEARLSAEAASLDGVISRLDALEATPADTTGGQQTGGTTGGTVGSADPNAPTGSEQPLEQA